jgi:hypothetical protein
MLLHVKRKVVFANQMKNVQLNGQSQYSSI